MKILVVDDHQLFVEGLSLLLETRFKGSEVFTVNNATDALSLIGEQDDIDLLTIDLSMPGLDGFALLTAIKERQLLIPTVVVSATQNIADVARAMETGALGYIPKSFDGETTIAAIQQVLQGFTYLPADIGDQVRSLLRSSTAKRQHKRDLELSPRQRTILQLIRDGLSNRDIATTLDITESTVKSHISALFDLLDARNRTECIRHADRIGIIEPGVSSHSH